MRPALRELLVSLDLEMNQPSRDIIQIGAVIGNVKTGEIVSRFGSFVNPQEPLDPRITQLTKITQADVDAAPFFINAYKALLKWLAPFDELRVLNPLTWSGGDTDKLYEQLLRTGLGVDNWPFGRRWLDVKTIFVAWRMAQGHEIQGGLARAMTKVGLNFNGQKHNALADAENTFRMYRALIKQFNVTGYLQG